ncbi:MAG: hypothetical protein JWN25_2365 [Verrucomicrobiales bacterium]|nr:hypothetical protein [Verrucomicrobiales bacterium]
METLTEQLNFERFGEMALSDPELHAQLRATPNEDAFVVLAVRLGSERGCDFSTSVVRSALQEKRRAWLERWL